MMIMSILGGASLLVAAASLSAGSLTERTTFFCGDRKEFIDGGKFTTVFSSPRVSILYDIDGDEDPQFHDPQISVEFKKENGKVHLIFGGDDRKGGIRVLQAWNKWQKNSKNWRDSLTKVAISIGPPKFICLPKENEDIPGLNGALRKLVLIAPAPLEKHQCYNLETKVDSLAVDKLLPRNSVPPKRQSRDRREGLTPKSFLLKDHLESQLKERKVYFYAPCKLLDLPCDPDLESDPTLTESPFRINISSNNVIKFIRGRRKDPVPHTEVFEAWKQWRQCKCCPWPRALCVPTKDNKASVAVLLSSSRRCPLADPKTSFLPAPYVAYQLEVKGSRQKS